MKKKTARKHIVRQASKKGKRASCPPGAKRGAKSGVGDARRVDAALKRLQQALRLTTTRAEDILAVAHALGKTAVEKNTRSLIRDLCEKQFLRDLVELRDALADGGASTLSPRLQSLRLLPNALIQWFEHRFEVVPFGRAGEELDLPVSKLGNYSCEFDIPSDPMALVRVLVVSPGWKRGNVLLIPPRVRLSQQQTPGVEELNA